MENKEHPLTKFRFCPVCGSGRFVVNNVKSKKCVDCGFIYYFNPSAAVACFVRDDRDRVLVAVRGNEPAKGTLDLPGGFVDMDETGEQAAARELKEETGLVPLSVKYLFSIPNLYMYSGFEVQTLDMFFECRIEDIETARASDDVSDVVIMNKYELDSNDFGLISVRSAVERYKKYKS